VRAQRQSLLLQLPAVLVLHLKRFTFDQHGPHKVSKPIRFGEALKLRSTFLAASASYCNGGRAGTPSYRLVAVVSHHGKSLNGGHYTCDVRSRDDEWCHCDDSNVRQVAVVEVLRRQAYVLFYQRDEN
jgi:ubiquitin carboxyl-terminal hydrolase 10